MFQGSSSGEFWLSLMKRLMVYKQASFLKGFKSPQICTMMIPIRFLSPGSIVFLLIYVNTHHISLIISSLSKPPVKQNYPTPLIPEDQSVNK